MTWIHVLQWMLAVAASCGVLVVVLLLTGRRYGAGYNHGYDAAKVDARIALTRFYTTANEYWRQNHVISWHELLGKADQVADVVGKTPPQVLAELDALVVGSIQHNHSQR